MSDFIFFILFEATVVFLLYLFNRRIKIVLFRPINFFLIFLLFSVFTGYVGYLVFVTKRIVDYRINFGPLFSVYSFALFGVIAGYLFCRQGITPVLLLGHNKPSERSSYSFNVSSLDMVASFFVITGFIAMILWFSYTEIIPMLYKGDKNLIRFEFIRTPFFSNFSRLIYIGSIALGLKLTTMKLLWPGKNYIAKTIDWLMVIGNFTVLFLYASKLLYLFPILLYLINYSFFVEPFFIEKLITPRNLSLIILLVISMVIITNIRHLQRPISVDIVADSFAVFVPVFGNDARIMELKKTQNLGFSTLNNLWAAGLPHEIFDLFGIDKKELIKVPPFSKMLGATWEGGMSLSIIMEIFVNAGRKGVLIGMFIYGMILSFLEVLLANFRRYSFGIIIVNTMVLYLVCFLAWDLGNLPLVYLQLEFLLVVYFFIEFLQFLKKNKEPAA